MEFWKIKLIRNNFGITMPSEILRVSIFISYLRKFYGARNLLFSKVTKKFSWTYTLEFWAEIFSQYSPLKVEEHNVPSEFRSDAWFMRKKIVSILKKPHCSCVQFFLEKSWMCMSGRFWLFHGFLSLLIVFISVWKHLAEFGL